MILDRLLRRRASTPGGFTSASAPRRSAPAEGFRIGSPGEAIDDLFLAQLRRVSLVSQRKLTAGRTGEHPSHRRSNALEFADYRSYAPGDDLRRVDWNAYLRLNHLFVKLADAPERLDLHLLLDTSSSMAWGHPNKFSYARRLAVGLAYVALAHMDAVSLHALRGSRSVRLFREESPSAMGKVVRAVGSAKPEGSTELDSALRGYTAMGSHRGVAVLISDLLSPSGYEAGLERLSQGALRPVVIHILSPEEMNPALEGDLELKDVETADTVKVSVDWGTLVRYRRWMREWFAGIEEFCSRRDITYVRAETSYSVEQLLLDRLRSERVVR